MNIIDPVNDISETTLMLLQRGCVTEIIVTIDVCGSLQTVFWKNTDKGKHLFNG